MDYVTIFEARLHTGVSEVTIRRAIKSGKITTLPRTNENEPYLIPVDELEKLKPHDDYALLSQRIDNQKERTDTLYELLAAQEFRIKQLEETIRTITRSEAQQTTVTTKPSTHPPQQRKDTPPSQDAITLQEFADQLAISRTTLREYVVSHDLPHIAIPDPARPKETKRYFTAEQQTAYKQHRKLV